MNNEYKSTKNKNKILLRTILLNGTIIKIKNESNSKKYV